MIETLRNAWKLFRRHPSLALPVAIADILHFCISLLEGFVRQSILQAWATRHEAVQSVLLGNSGGRSFLPSRGAMEAIVAVSHVVPLFLGALLYSGALYASLRMVQKFSRRDGGLASKTVFSPWPATAMLRLACWVFGVGVMVNVAVLLLAIRLQTTRPQWVGTLSIVEAMVQMLLSGWLIAPFAVRFVAELCNRTVSKEAIFKGKVLAALTVALSTGVMYATNPVISRMFDHGVYVTAVTLSGVRAAQSLLSAVPYMLLFGALALLVCGDPPAANDADLPAE